MKIESEEQVPVMYNLATIFLFFSYGLFYILNDCNVNIIYLIISDYLTLNDYNYSFHPLELKKKNQFQRDISSSIVIGDTGLHS